MRTLLYQGSVKNIYQTGKDVLEFEFTDQYSIFDWGVMPDKIENKGKSLAKMASYFFKKFQTPETFQNFFKNNTFENSYFKDKKFEKIVSELSKNAASTHFIDYLSPQSILVKKVNVLHPKFENSTYIYPKELNSATETLIPLEVVFRLGAPKGSSYLKRNPEFKEDTLFNEVKVEFFSKLEPQDRYLSTSEAKAISGLSEVELEEIIFKTKTYALVLKEIFKKSQINLWDGKFEFAYGKFNENSRDIVLVDSIGADELRLTHGKTTLSKEFLRKIYKKDPWYKQLSKNKNDYPQSFLEKTKLKPAPLSEEAKEASSQLYTSLLTCLENNDAFSAPRLESYYFDHFKSICIFGQGGREHALSDHLSKDPRVEKVYVVPGNDGMSGDKIETIAIAKDHYVSFCKSKKIDFAIIGPEALLEEGLCNELELANIACASPTKEAALLESSKAFSKKFMQKYNIPTAAFEVFNNKDKAISYINSSNKKEFVIKLSGLAAGKGVILCYSKPEAIEAINLLAPNNEEIVIEDLLRGKEVSYFALCLEESFYELGTACDHKRLLDGDKGPNTGGMGCFSPAYWLTRDLESKIKTDILLPTLSGLKKEGIFFGGTLFIGILISENTPYVLEYNTRFGDPETQTILPRLKNSLLDALEAIALKDKELLNSQKSEFNSPYSVHVVKAAYGYPGVKGEKVRKGDKIEISQHASEHTKIFFAGVKNNKGSLVTNGGRVLGITALNEKLEGARKTAYESLTKVHFLGEQYRKDIGL